MSGYNYTPRVVSLSTSAIQYSYYYDPSDSGNGNYRNCSGYCLGIGK